MKIIRVIVDELPLSTSRCDMSTVHWNPIIFREIVNCKIREEYLSMTEMTETEYFSTRCPGCPLALADAQNIYNGKELRQSYKYDKTCSTCRYLDENRDCVLGIRCVNYILWQGKIL